MNAFKESILIFAMFFVTALSLTLAQSVDALMIVDDQTGGDCNSVGKWNAKAKTCTLTTDVNATDLSEIGISIGGDNISLLCNGHSITGLGIDYDQTGVHVLGRTGVAIKSCIFESLNVGIFIGTSNKATLKNNTFTSNGTGMYIAFANTTTLKNNTVNSNSIGIYLVLSDNNTFNDNAADSNGIGIWLDRSNNNTFTDNTFNSNGYLGTFIADSNNNTFNDNTADNNGQYGYLDYWYDSNTFNDNQCSNNGIGGSDPTGLCSPQP